MVFDVFSEEVDDFWPEIFLRFHARNFFTSPHIDDA